MFQQLTSTVYQWSTASGYQNSSSDGGSSLALRFNSFSTISICRFTAGDCPEDLRDEDPPNGDQPNGDQVSGDQLNDDLRDEDYPNDDPREEDFPFPLLGVCGVPGSSYRSAFSANLGSLNAASWTSFE